MQISDLRRTARDRLVDFAWDEWAQMGVSASARRVDRSAQDPEALLLFTFEVAREDPRLFGEVLDWLALNERLVSVQRLRNLCRADAYDGSRGALPGARASKCPKGQTLAIATDLALLSAAHMSCNAVARRSRGTADSFLRLCRGLRRDSCLARPLRSLSSPAVLLSAPVRN